MNELKLNEMVELLKEDSRQSLTQLSRKLDLSIIETLDYLKEVKKKHQFTIIKME